MKPFVVKVEKDCIIDVFEGHSCTGGIGSVIFEDAFFVIPLQLPYRTGKQVADLLTDSCFRQGSWKSAFGIRPNQIVVYMQGKPAELVAEQLLNYQGMNPIPPDVVIKPLRHPLQVVRTGLSQDFGKAFSMFKERLEDKGFVHDATLAEFVSKFKPYF